MTTTTDTAESPAPWSLNPAEFTATKDKLEKINSRAIKRGFTGRIDITGTERTVTETTPLGEEHAHVVIDTTITGQAPSYDGWEFLAAVDTVETEEGTEFIVRTAPGVDEVDIDRSTLIPGYCAHCNLTRTEPRLHLPRAQHRNPRGPPGRQDLHERLHRMEHAARFHQ